MKRNKRTLCGTMRSPGSARRHAAKTTLKKSLLLLLALLTPVLSTCASSPVAGKIAFSSDRDKNSEIYVMNADGTDLKGLTHEPAADTNPIWSPDGRYLIFTAMYDGNHEIYVVRPDGSALIRLTDNPALDFGSSWSP